MNAEITLNGLKFQIRFIKLKPEGWGRAYVRDSGVWDRQIISDGGGSLCQK